MPNGENVTLQFAERGSWIGSGKESLWVKEVRKLSEEGHQVSLITTAYGLEAAKVGGRLFSRWCQENFFRYMMQHFAIDLLSEYENRPLHDTTRVVNPAWLGLESQRKCVESKLRYRRARFADWSLHRIPASETQKYEKRESQQAQLLEEIQRLESELEGVKKERNKTPSHIHWKDLPKEHQFCQPVLERKRLMDAVRMIAYRAETAMSGLLMHPGVESEGEENGVGKAGAKDTAAARRVLQDLFVSEADLRPDPEAGILHVEVHRGSRPAVDRILRELFVKLNEMEFEFPGTELKIRYRLLGDEEVPRKNPVSLLTSQR